MEKTHLSQNSIRQIKENLYKELLQSSPNAPVFFSYAQILAEENKSSEAIAILKAGLQQYPDHFSARLLLIELLYQKGLVDSAHQEFDLLISPFISNKTFWKLLENSSFLSKEQKLFIRLLSAGLDTGVSLADLVDAGKTALQEKLGQIQQQEQGAIQNKNVQSGIKENSSSQSIAFLSEKQDRFTAAKSASPSKNDTAQDLIDNNISLQEKNCVAPEDKIRTAIKKQCPSDTQTQYSSENIRQKGKNSIVTLTMADLLLEQGEYEEALSICRELSEKVKSPEEYNEITKRIQRINQYTSDTALNDDRQKKIILFLNQLAERLNSCSNQPA